MQVCVEIKLSGLSSELWQELPNRGDYFSAGPDKITPSLSHKEGRAAQLEGGVQTPCRHVHAAKT